MKQIGLLFFLLWVSFAALARGGDKVVYFAPLPMENPQLSLYKSKHFTEALTEALGVRVQTKFYASYGDILQAFVAGEIDLVELGPFNYLKLKTMTSAERPLAMIRQYQNQAYYRCVLMAPIDGIAHLKDMTQVAAPSVALTQPLSTCGWFSTEYFFRQMGLDLNQFPHHYIGSHEGVALSLLRQEYTVGSVASHIGERFAELGLKVLAESPNLPLFSIVGNPKSLSQAQLDLIAHYLQGLSSAQTPDWGLGRYGFMPFSTALLHEFELMVMRMHPEQQELK